MNFIRYFSKKKKINMHIIDSMNTLFFFIVLSGHYAFFFHRDFPTQKLYMLLTMNISINK